MANCEHYSVNHTMHVFLAVDYEALLTRNKELEDQIRAREEAEDEELVRYELKVFPLCSASGACLQPQGRRGVAHL